MEFWDLFIGKFNFLAYIALMMLGFYGMIAKNNIIKKIIGLNIFQTAIILFFISTGAKKGATIPIIKHGHGAGHHAIHAADYVNPLPHVLMLTAIVVSVATLGMALALSIRIYKRFNTLEESEILAQVRKK